MDHNQKIIDNFQKLVELSNGTDNKNKFRRINYKKVIGIFSNLDTSVETMEDVLQVLRNGGMKLTNERPPTYKSQILLKIQEILETGQLKSVTELEKDPKLDIIKQLVVIPEVGPSKAEELYQKGIRSISDLQNQPDLLNRKQLIGFKYLNDLQTRIPREEMDKWSTLLKQISNISLGNKSKSIISMELAGSYRRGNADSGDVDFYIAVKKIDKTIMENIVQMLISLGIIQSEDIISKGVKKTMTIAKLSPDSPARHLDIFVFDQTQYPFALMFATGSGQFNIRFRKYALSQGWSLSDKALREKNSKGPPPSMDLIQQKIGKSEINNEQDIFHFFNLKYIPPHLRNATVELVSL